jgi:hypothetical protein
MKKVILALGAVIIILNASAQLRVGVQAGASVVGPKITVAGTGTTYSDQGFTFLYPGIVFDYKVGNAFSVRPSANFLQTGMNSSQTIGGLLTQNRVRINNVHVPIDLVVPIKLGKGKLEIMAGPSLVLSLNGNSSTTVAGGTPVNRNLTFGNDTVSLKQINWGTSFGAGYRFESGIGLRAMYNLAMADQDNSAAGSARYNTLTTTVSYFLFGNKK